MNTTTSSTFTNLTEFNNALSTVSETLQKNWEGRQVGELKTNLNSAQEMIQKNQTLLSDSRNPETVRFIKTAKQLSTLMKETGQDGSMVATAIKASALSFSQLGSENIAESINAISQLNEVDHDLYLQTLASWINTQKIPLKKLALPEENFLNWLLY